MKHPRPHTAAWYQVRRDKNMRAARSWAVVYRNRGDAGSLQQMRIRIDWARKNNHDAIAARKAGRP